MLVIDWKGRHPNSYSEKERKAIILPVLAAAVSRFNGKMDVSKYNGMKTKMPFSCSEGHHFETLPKTVIKGHWCLACSQPKKATNRPSISRNNKYKLEDAKSIANQRNGKCLTSTYQSKLTWECERKHVWEAAFNDVKNGTWCRECRRLEPLIRLKDVVRTKKGSFNDNAYEHTKIAIEFTCEQGHSWKAKPSAILRGSWCKKCWIENEAGKHLVVDRIPDANRIAQERGGFCLTDTWINSGVKLSWRCANNHTWDAHFHDVQKGSWCPTCGKGIRERLCRHYFEQLTGLAFPSFKPKWLLNAKNNRMELDGYCKELLLAFEHQGRQHYQKIEHFNRRNESLNWRLESDVLKRKICKERSITLIEVPYWVENDSLPEWIANQISKTRPEIKLAAIPLPLSYVSSDELSNLQEIAISKGGECLSPVYLGVFGLHKFRCEKGHIWYAAPSNIIHSRGVGTWCPECKNEKIGDSNRKYTVSDMQELAMQREGKFLSKEFISVNIRHLWECKKAHRWNAAPSDVLRGTWCSQCSLEAKTHSIETANDVAAVRGGKCISVDSDYVNSYSYLQWECEKNHRWWARYNNVKNSNSWCAECKGRRPKYIEKPK